MNAREGGVLFLTAWAARLDWDGAELDVLRLQCRECWGQINQMEDIRADDIYL